jgi:hypothetical protein
VNRLEVHKILGATLCVTLSAVQMSLTSESRYTESIKKILSHRMPKIRGFLPETGAQEPPALFCSRSWKSSSPNLSQSQQSSSHLLTFASSNPLSRYLIPNTFIPSRSGAGLGVSDELQTAFTTAAQRPELDEHLPAQLRSYLLGVNPSSFRDPRPTSSHRSPQQ